MAENFFGITDTGRVRDNNEDAFIAKKVMDNKFIIACAIDGVGGYSGGEIAAEIARESIFENFAKPTGDLIAAMKASFVTANQKIFAEKLQTKEHSKMACVLTLAVVDVANNQFHYAHVGDTRLYLLRDNSLVKVSKDHSFVGFLEDSGRLDEDAAMKHIKRNEINKALGFGKDIETQDDYIETGTSPFLPGDMLLLCSDGLTDMVNKDSITQTLTGNTSLEEKATKLVAIANNNGGKDNITVVLVQNDAASTWPGAGSIKEPTIKSSVKEPSPQITNETPIRESNIKPGVGVIHESASNESSPDVKKKTTIHETPVHAKNNLSKILAIACFILLGSTLYLLWKSNKNKPDENGVETEITDTRNAQEIKLQESINSLSGDTLVLSDSLFKQPVIISDTITIHQDSLYIISKGKIVLRADSTFHGPAFSLSPDSKFVTLKGLQFENFDVAISAQNDALYLQNVQFLNCKWPVQNFIAFPEKQFITGRLAGSFFFKTDSLNQSER